MTQSERGTSGAAPARPGHIAEWEEYETARKAGTRAALELFLARHPESRYAPLAKRLLSEIK